MNSTLSLAGAKEGDTLIFWGRSAWFSINQDSPNLGISMDLSLANLQ